MILSNLLMYGHLLAFYRLDQAAIYSYYEAFEEAMVETKGCSEVAKHLQNLQVHPHLYLFNWLQTLFLKVLPFSLANRVLDCFLLDGTEFLIRVSVAVVRLFRKYLLQGSFEDCIKLLSCSPGEEVLWNKEITEKVLFAAIEKVSLTSSTSSRISALDEACNQMQNAPFRPSPKGKPRQSSFVDTPVTVGAEQHRR